jgi:hypothetical protein
MLFLLVEGDDDERFVQHIVVPKLSSRYDFVKPWKFAQERKEKVNQFLRSLKAMGAEYLLLADLNAYPCFAKKKELCWTRSGNWRVGKPSLLSGKSKVGI